MLCCHVRCEHFLIREYTITVYLRVHPRHSFTGVDKKENKKSEQHDEFVYQIGQIGRI